MQLGGCLMLSRLILLLLQAAVAWVAAPYIVRYIPGPREVSAVRLRRRCSPCWCGLSGWCCAQVLRETGQPSSATLVAALVVALIGAALVDVAAGGLDLRARACAPSPSSSIR